MYHSSHFQDFRRLSENGFVILGMVCIMMIMGITAVALNRNASMQVKMTEAYVDSVQIRQGQHALTEWASWKLNSDPFYRTPEGGLIKTFAGHDYIIFIMQMTGTDFEDAVAISVSPLGGSSIPTITTAVRLYVEDLLPLPKIPEYVCTDSYGNIYFSDVTSHVVYKMDSNSEKITVFAGNGSAGYSGDGRKAVNAQLNGPRGLAFHGGYLYIADTDNHCIRKVNGSGYISTVAGKGEQGYYGNDYYAHRAKMNMPHDICISGINMYIADTGNHRIRRVNLYKNKIYDFAGTGDEGFSGNDVNALYAKLSSPQGVTVYNDSGGDKVYVADTGNHRIRMIYPVKVPTGDDGDTMTIIKIKTAGGTGEDGYDGDGSYATSADISSPRDVYADSSDNIYLTTSNGVRYIYHYSSSKIKIATVAGGPKAGYDGDGQSAENAKLKMPTGVAQRSSGELLIADTGNSTIREIDLSDRISSLFEGGPNFKQPTQLALYYDSETMREYLYVTDTAYHEIKRIDLADKTVRVFAGNGSDKCTSEETIRDKDELSMKNPEGITVDPETGDIYYSDTGCHCVRKIDAEYGWATLIAGTPGSDGRIDDGYDLCDPFGKAAFDQLSSFGFSPSLVKLKNPKGLYYNTFRKSLIIVDSENCLAFDLDFSKNRMKFSGRLECINNKVNPCGNDEDFNVPFARPLSAYVDPVGHTFISDSENHRIMKRHKSSSFSSRSLFKRYAGIHDRAGFTDGNPLSEAKFDNPYGFASNSKDQMYITDYSNHSIRVYLNGEIETFSGLSGKKGNNKEKTPAVDAKYHKPAGIAVSQGSQKRIYIADSGNKKLRVIYMQTEPLIYRLPSLPSTIPTTTTSTSTTSSTTTIKTTTSTTTTVKSYEGESGDGSNCRKVCAGWFCLTICN